MNRLNTKNNVTDLEEAKRSGMLVDLRQPNKEKESPASLHVKKKRKNYSFLTKAKRNKKNKNSGLKIIFKDKKKSKKQSNFLKSEKISLLQSLSLNLFPKKRKSKNNIKIKPLFKKKKNKFWQKTVRDKKKIFNLPFKYRKKRLEETEIKLGVYRSLFSFALVLLLLIVPLKVLSFFQILDLSSLEQKLFSHSEAAISKLGEAGTSVSELDFLSASSKFSLASAEFLLAEDELAKINSSLLSLAALSNNPKYKLAAESKQILSAGALASSLGANLSLATEPLFNQQEGGSLLLALEEFSKYGSLALLDSKDLKQTIQKININNLPQEYREQFKDLKEKADFLSQNLEEIIDISSKMHELLGMSQDKRYLLIFQNNAELRASGGFLGSYAIVDLKEGGIKNLEVPAGGSYDTEGGMTVSVKAPKPLWLVNPLWHFWDANWWPDWPTTAKNLMWFYEKSGGSSVDGVITFTPTVLESLLEITGAIDMSEEYGVIIDSHNFWETVQKIVEHDNLEISNPGETIDFIDSKNAIESNIPLYQDLETNIDNKPKKIIGDLMVRILEILPEKLNKDNLGKIVSLLENNKQGKQFMLYFKDADLQAEVLKRNAGGEIKEAPHDYLLVVNTNIAGQKTDRKMSEDISHVSQIDIDGKIVNKLNIKRQHEGIKNEALSGVRNVNWLRVYVPLGSKPLSASGFSEPDAKYFEEAEDSWLDSEFLADEDKAILDKKTGLKVYQENGKTVFAAWVMTDPGMSADIEISYELPFNFYDGYLDLSPESGTSLSVLQKLFKQNRPDFLNYSLLVQKQAGAKPSKFSSVLILADELDLVYQHPKGLIYSSGWKIKDELNSDKYYSLLLK